MKIAVILPSRGLMFSKTADEILQNLKGVNHRFFFAHKKPIPDCFEEPTERAMKDEEITHLWFVEDDMVLPFDILKQMINCQTDVVAVDYPVSKKGQGALFKTHDRVIFCGTGCLLVKREVFDKLKKPYFRSDIGWSAINYGKKLVKLTATDRGKNFKTYGLHDVTFGVKLFKAHIPIEVLPITLGQRKLVALGKAGTNDGAHQIEEWTKVKPDVLLKEIYKYPVTPRGSLVSVDTPSGTISTDKAHAARMIKAGVGTRPGKTTIIIDASEVDI